MWKKTVETRFRPLYVSALHVRDLLRQHDQSAVEAALDVCSVLSPVMPSIAAAGAKTKGSAVGLFLFGFGLLLLIIHLFLFVSHDISNTWFFQNLYWATVFDDMFQSITEP